MFRPDPKPKKKTKTKKARINRISSGNTYSSSDGQRWTSKEVENKIREAKQAKIDLIVDEFGYVFCEACKRNDCVPVDCSHDKSVQWCKDNGCVELAWDVENITMRGRRCHQKHDKLN